MAVKGNMGDFRAACRRAAAGEEFKMVDQSKKQLSPGVRVVLHVLIHGGSNLPVCAERLPGFYRELLSLGLVKLDGDLEWQPTELGRKSNKKLLESGWGR